MPSARDLLEQADALMRKNRARGDGDIPLLTDAVEIAIVPATAPIFAPALVPASVLTPVSTGVAAAEDVPLLTDAVDEVVLDFEPLPPTSAALGAIMEGDPPDWLVMDTIDPASHSITGRAPDTLTVVPLMTLKAAGSAPTPPPMGSQPSASEPGEGEHPEAEPLGVDPLAAATLESVTPPPEPVALPPEPMTTELEADGALELSLPELDADSVAEPTLPVLEAAQSAPAAADQELWRALAEQVSMQVLQRLDLFTDTGLKEQLAQRLEPIVERASAELVGAITEHVGRLVRTYVSEAIEREIAQWKRDQQ